jgi:hypothetical protein
LEIYTVDSIGGWTHWGGGATAIGRNNQKIRVHLAAELQKRKTNNTQLITIEYAVRIRPSEITIPYLFRKTWTQNNLFMPGQRSKGIIPY